MAPITPAQLSLSFLASRQAFRMPIDSSSKVTASSQRHSTPTYSRLVYDAAMGSTPLWAVWFDIGSSCEKAAADGVGVARGAADKWACCSLAARCMHACEANRHAQKKKRSSS